MGRTSLSRTIAAVLTATALFLTSAGACGPGEDDDGDGGPGVTQQDDDGGDEGGDD